MKNYVAPEIILHQSVVFESGYGSGYCEDDPVGGGGTGSGSGKKPKPDKPGRP